MPRRGWLILIAGCVLIAPIGFALGRWTGTPPRLSVATDQDSIPEFGADRERGRSRETATDYSSVTIEKLGQVEFDEAFGLLHAAPKDALTAWTKRLEGLPVGPRRTAGITAFFKTLAQIDTRTAVDLALSMNVHEPRWNAIGAISNATPAANLNEVARMYIALGEKKLALTDFVLSWSRSDPVATAEFLSNYTGDVDHDDVRQLMANWAALDPVAAKEWLVNHPHHRDEKVYAGFYSGWLEHDRAAALNDLRSRLDDETFNKALETVSKELFKNSDEEARAFILALPQAAQKTGVYAIVGDVTAVYLSGAPDLQADEVARWLITLPQNLWRGNLGQILDRWDQDARDGWIEQLPADTRDLVLADYCEAYGLYVPTENFRAGLRIRDPKLRQETFHKIFDNMDPEVRQSLLTNAQLLPAEAKELARILK
jgi:hypothetical protein